MDITTNKTNVDYTSGTIAKDSMPGASDGTNNVAKGIQTGAAGIPDTQSKAFLSVVQDTDLSPKASTQPASDPEVEAKFKQIEQLLNSSDSSDAARLLGRLLVELGALQRKEALTDRLLARDAAQSELKAGANKLDAAATATMVGAGASLALGMVSAAISISYAGASAKMQLTGPPGQATSTAAQTTNMKGGAIAGVSSSLGQFSNSMAQATSQTFQADQAREQANAEVTKSEGEMEATEQQALQEFINQMIQFIKEMRDAEVEQLAVVTRG